MCSNHIVELGNEEKNPLESRTHYLKNIFDQFDTDNDGAISVFELSKMLKYHEYDKNKIPLHVVERIHYMADLNHDGKIDFEEFMKMTKHPVIKNYMTRYVDKYVKLVVPPGTRRVRNSYASEYTCCPPPLGMIMISMIELIIHIMNKSECSANTKEADLAKMLIFEPSKRQECWRFLTYMFVHAGTEHLMANLVVQIVLAVPLEMVHRWWRILLIYFAGVLAGSLGHSLVHPTLSLAGASGGVYAILLAHLSTMVLNWTEIPLLHRAMHLGFYILFFIVDIGNIIYTNLYTTEGRTVGYMAHFCGALAGLLVGINIMRNLRVTKREIIIWWISIVTFVSLLGVCILLNIFWTSHFEQKERKIV